MSKLQVLMLMLLSCILLIVTVSVSYKFLYEDCVNKGFPVDKCKKMMKL